MGTNKPLSSTSWKYTITVLYYITISNSKRYSPWQLWLKLCLSYNRIISQLFGWLGEKVATNPSRTFIFTFFVLAVCAIGFAFFKAENRTERLYIPQDSTSIKNLRKAGDYGFYRPSRKAEIILFEKGGNVLTEACFNDALKLHKSIVSIPGYKEVCLPNLQSEPMAKISYCKREEPLWMFNYTANFTNLIRTLNKYFPTNDALFRRIVGIAELDNNGLIKSAQALRLTYNIRGVDIDDDIDEATEDWEKEFLEMMDNYGDIECGSLVYTAERSIDDAIAESTGSDTKFISLTFTLMISFSCVMLGKYRNPLTGHGLLTMCGILCVGFGIVAGFGLSMLSRIPLVSIVGILPFLIIGVGIDDMFIMVDELDRVEPHESIPKRIAAVLKTVGPSVTMTTMTDLMAFAVGTSSKFPSIVFFCTYAALAVAFSFLFLITIFVAFMSYDCRRIVSGRRDMVPCLFAPSPPPGAPRWDAPLPQLSNKFMESWGKMIMKTPVKIILVFLSLGLLAAGIYGTTFVNEEFDRRDLAKDGAVFIRFLDTEEDYFDIYIPVDLILESGVNYSDPITQIHLHNLTQVVTENKYYDDEVISWFSNFQQWYNAQSKTKTFMDSLDLFLQDQPQFKKDILFAEDNSTIQASRFHCNLIDPSSSSVKLREAMLSLRDDLRDKTSLPVFSSTYQFIFVEQFVSTLPETVRNLSLAAASIIVVTSLFLVNPLVILLVLLGFVSLIFELLGFMHLWGVSLNSISMINLVMAIGFAVDYSAHVAHSFVFSCQSSPEENVIHALKTAGASVLMGGFSTFLGMVVTAFASSQIFRIFFKMFLGIVVLGLLHGLCFLPIWLSIVCRWKIVVRPHEEETDDIEMKHNVTNGTSVSKDHVTSYDNNVETSLPPATQTDNKQDLGGNVDTNSQQLRNKENLKS